MIKESSPGKEIEKSVIEEIFSAPQYKEAILEAAKESAEDQKKMLRKYNRLINK